MKTLQHIVNLRLMILFAAAIPLLTYWSVASAESQSHPIREPFPSTDLTGRYCPDFPVLIHPLVNRELTTIYSDGRVHISGTAILQLTNVTTGKSIVVNASGPGTYTADGTALIAEGLLMLFGEAGFFGAGSPAELSLNKGLTVLSLIDNSILSRARNTEDLCPSLRN